MDYAKESLRLHAEWKGKIEVKATVPVETKDDLSLAYTPGVAQPCLEIQKDINKSYELTRRWNLCAVITLAGLTNALKVVGKKKEDVKVVTSGAGAAAISIVKLLLSAGFRNVTMCDRKGAIYKGRDGLNWIKEEMAEVTNLDRKSGSLADMLVGADVFIGVSAPGTVTSEMVRTMNRDAIIFACMANGREKSR